jgi:hypothetical protein
MGDCSVSERLELDQLYAINTLLHAGATNRANCHWRIRFDGCERLADAGYAFDRRHGFIE